MTNDRQPTGEAQPSDTGSVESSPAPADTKPKTPFESAAKVVRNVRLESVSFGDFSAALLDRRERLLEDDVIISASTKFLRPTAERDGDGFATKTTIIFEIARKLPDDAPSQPVAIIRAALGAEYVLKPDSPEFSDDELKDYALCYCPFHVWGYWREFVQSSLARLDLPQFTLPLFLIQQAPNMVRDKLE